MNEKTFVTELMADFKKQGVFIRKIPDFPVSYVEGEVGKGKPRFLPAKPFDLFGNFPGGTALYIEAKMKKQLGAFPLSSIRPLQLEELTTAGKTQAVALFAINYRIVIPKDDGGKVETQIEKYGLTSYIQANRLNLLTVLLPYDVLQAQESKLKSIAMAELFDPEAKCFVNRPWGGRWEVKEVIAAVHGRMSRG